MVKHPELRDKISSLILPYLTRPQQHVLFILAFGAILVLAASSLAIEVRYHDRTYPGVKAGGVLVGGLTKAELTSRLQTSSQKFLQTPLTIRSSNQEITLNLSDLSSIDFQKTANQVYELGRSEDFGHDWNERIKSITGQKDVPLSFVVDQQKLDQALQTLIQKVDRPSTDATIQFNDNEAYVVASADGRQIDLEKLRSLIYSHIATLNSNPVQLDPVVTHPKVSEVDTSLALVEAKQALQGSLTLQWNNKNWTLNQSQIENLLDFKTSEQADLLSVGDQNQLQIGQFRLVKDAKALSGNPPLHLSINRDRLAQFVQTIAASINQPAGEPRLKFEGGQLQLLASGQEGRIVDQDRLASNIIVSLTGSNRNVVVPVKISQPQITLDKLNQLGIKELIGSGSSFYSGSIPGRNQNIQVAASLVNGTLIAPGQVFSMYDAIGEVTPDKGYTTSYVIIGHRTELGLGGGVCQVSTTLFRAALNTGLPIVERHPHAYRVHYYEQNSGPGLDATVFFPGVDFKFRNDTPNWILIQTINDPANAKLTFEFYGTSDGRKSSISTPIVTDVTPPPAPLYQDDPTLPKGTTKQVDWEVEGATAVFSRTVTRGGQTIINDTYYTRYQPWQSVFMVGTKES